MTLLPEVNTFTFQLDATDEFLLQILLFAQPSVTNPPAPHTQQNTASKAAARKPDTQPSTPHCTDNLKTKVCTAYF
jgi:hypothetical protein